MNGLSTVVDSSPSAPFVSMVILKPRSSNLFYNKDMQELIMEGSISVSNLYSELAQVKL